MGRRCEEWVRKDPGEKDELETLREEDPHEYWSQMEEEHGRDWVAGNQDPYNHDPALDE